MSVLEMLRAYTLREYAVVLAMAVLGSLGLVFMLNSMGGGATSGETLLKRETVIRKNTASLRFVEENAAARARAKAADLRRARILAARRIVAQSGSSPRKRRGSAPLGDPVDCDSHHPAGPGASADPCGQPAPSRPAPRPQAAPAPKPTPKKSGSSGGGGGAFDDSG